MRNIILTVVLTLVSSAATAEWVKFQETKYQKTTFYLDTDSIKKIGYKRRVWIMQSLSQRRIIDSDKSFYSAKTQRLVNCREEETTVKYLVMYSEKMGHGDVVGKLAYKDFDNQYTPIIPDSVNDSLMKIVCR